MITGSCHCNAVHWTFTGQPETATACNCTVCRRFGALWAYGHEDGDVQTSGDTRSYTRTEGRLAFHFCPNCAGLAFWRLISSDDNQRRIGVNLRLAEPEAVAAIPIKHLDGFDSWEYLPRDGQCVGDMWF